MTEIMKADGSWVNPQNTFGSSSDSVQRTMYTNQSVLSLYEIEALYRNDWAARRYVTLIVEDLTREWMEVGTDNKKLATNVELLEDGLTDLSIREKWYEAFLLARMYGGAGLILGAFDGQELTKPLREDSIKYFNFLLPLDRYQLTPVSWVNNPASNKFGLPELYMAQPYTYGGASAFVVHESRVVRFNGNHLPGRLKYRAFSWGESVLESVYQELRRFGVVSQTGATLFQTFVEKVFKMSDLAEKLAAGRTEEVRQRVGMMAGTASVNGYSVIGKDDELIRLGMPITGMPEMVDKYVDFICAAFNIPKSRFMGNASGALGSSSADADVIAWYDRVRAEQTTHHTAPLLRIALLKSQAEKLSLGRKDINIKWRPLWQHSEKEKSEIMVNYANAYEKLIANDILLPSEIRQGVFGSEEINFTRINLDDKAYTDALEDAEETQALMLELKNAPKKNAQNFEEVGNASKKAETAVTQGVKE